MDVEYISDVIGKVTINARFMKNLAIEIIKIKVFVAFLEKKQNRHAIVHIPYE